MNDSAALKNYLSILFIACASVFSGHKAWADTIFVLDDTTPAFAPIETDGLNNGDVVTVDGIDLTFSNVVVSDGSAIGDVEGVGILISGEIDPNYTDVVSFDFSFSQDVEILTYDIGTWEDVPASSFFTVSGPNGTSGNNTIPAGSGFTEQEFSFAPGAIPFFQAGAVYSFSHNLVDGSDALFNLEEIVVRVIPEPSTGMFVVVGCAAGLCRRLRQIWV